MLARGKGSTIAELPPALILLLIVMFFPMINLLWLGVGYGAGMYLNMIEAREIVCHPPIEANGPSGNFVTPNYTVIQSQNWNGYMGVAEVPPSPQVAQFPSAINPVLVGQSTVKTTVTIKPFLKMLYFAKLPFLSKIPGLGKPLTCIYYSTVVQEEQGQ